MDDAGATLPGARRGSNRLRLHRMGHRLSWIRRYTTVEDLLDDGVENFSDVKRAVGQADNATEDVLADPTAAAAIQQHRERLRKEAEARPRRRGYSGVGLLLAIAMIAGGAVMVELAPDMWVEHARRYTRSSVEHVTPMRARVYGVSLLLCGAALGWFSIVRRD